MPAKSPPTGPLLASRLTALGARVRAQREAQKVTATAAAEAAGLSRVTLHRIERGEPSVTMGAYLSALDAMGLLLELCDPNTRQQPAQTILPASVRLDDFPQLKALAWQSDGATELSPAQALSLYERNWRHIDAAALVPAERALIDSLITGLGGGRLLV